jgi:hypothetical protein
MEILKRTQNKYCCTESLSLVISSTNSRRRSLAQAIKHAEAATKAQGGKAIAEHAETAKTQAKTADEHLDAAIKSLDDSIAQGKLRNDDLAKKAAEEAITHLKAAQ